MWWKPLASWLLFGGDHKWSVATSKLLFVGDKHKNKPKVAQRCLLLHKRRSGTYLQSLLPSVHTVCSCSLLQTSTPCTVEASPSSLGETTPLQANWHRSAEPRLWCRRYERHPRCLISSSIPFTEFSFCVTCCRWAPQTDSLVTRLQSSFSRCAHIMKSDVEYLHLFHLWPLDAQLDNRNTSVDLLTKAKTKKHR